MTGPLATQYITFTGQLANGKKEPEEYTLQILAGEGAPTVTGGWPEWLTVNRPQRVGMTVLQGYPPVKLSIPIRFEALTQGTLYGPGGTTARDVEREIQILEWMGGRGRASMPRNLSRNATVRKQQLNEVQPGGTFRESPGKDALGDSPLIQLATVTEANKNPLVPVQFQAPAMFFVVDGESGGIQFDPNPLRDAGGARVRQLATIFLKQYVGAPGTSADSAQARAEAKAGGEGRGKYHKTTSALNTVKKLVQHITKQTNTQVLKEVMAANKNNKPVGTNPNKKLKVGTRVYIPYNIEHHLSGG